EAAEKARLEQERERIRREEEAKAQAQAVAAAPPVARIDPEPVATPAAAPAPTSVRCEPPALSPTPSTHQEPPTLRLGTICERLGFNVSAECRRTIGFAPAGRERAAILYRESDFDRICVAIANHVSQVRLGHTQAA